MIFWILGAIGVLIGIFADYILFKIVKRTSGKLRISFNMFFFAAITYLAAIAFIILFVFTNTPITSFSWNIVPILFITASILWASSMFKLALIFKESEAPV